ncbi:MAG: hypothetical protein MJZ16_14335 [Bacteroidales bacterium]|nr:hypothetical protein [Bacteroidales bacterium]
MAKEVKTANSFKALKGMMGELEKGPSKSVASSSSTNKEPNAPRERTRIIPDRVPGVVKKKIKVVKERDGVTVGQRVRLMDTNDSGTVVGFIDGGIIAEIDGLEMNLFEGEYIIADYKEDNLLRNSISAKVKKSDSRPKQSEKNPANDVMIVDLHMEKIPEEEKIPWAENLECQLEYFRRIMRANFNRKGKKIVFIHGVGDGILKQALRKDLDELFALHCTYAPASSEMFGLGATMVTMR